MAVKTFSKKTDGNKQLTANFQVKEFACKDGSDKILIDTALVDILQKIRDWAGKPVHINSGYRTPAHNKSVGGGSNSRHLYGEAADFWVEGKTPAEVAKYAESIGVLGIGCYGGSAGSFVHVDTRTVKYFWTNNGSGDKAVATHGGAAKPPVTKTATELAKEVIDGKWGNGTDRKNRLTAAGYDYAAVQKQVDKLVGSKPAEKKTPKVGDIVTFSGGSHYSASNSTKATGSKRTAGTAKITAISTGAKHPYHLVGVKSNVYGWVDANLIK